MDERRQFSRILFDANAYLQQDQQTWSTTIIDLSLNGALVQLPSDFDASDAPIKLGFTLPGSDIEVSMQTSLVHRKDQQLGLKCLHIDIDSISHLRHMLALNLGDASLLNRELTLFIEAHENN
ncbi:MULTISPECIES: PilZ domain-containing protein [Shewanella]|uniref:PilZ domain-containing protein n=1 Tax=Shewanella TaxID=22 RepID=UPI000491506B|nr:MULTISPECIES: PilZ domain-containing protein [Shewanella]QLE86357.1 PilZ domain-containing protein [Shewanella sp. Scap07]